MSGFDAIAAMALTNMCEPCNYTFRPAHRSDSSSLLVDAAYVRAGQRLSRPITKAGPWCTIDESAHGTL